MSSLAFSSPAVASSAVVSGRAFSWGRLALVGAATSLVAAIANVGVYFAGDAIVGYDSAFVELGSAFGIAVCTAIPAIIAVLLYATLPRFSSNPVRLFTIISSVLLVATLVPDLTFIPGEPGASAAQTGILMLMHLVAAGVIVGMLTAFARPEAR